MSPGRCNVVESGRVGGGREEVRSGSGKVKVGLGGKYIIMAEKTAGEKIQILKKIERGQRTARPGVRRRGGEGGVFGVLGVYRRKGNIRARGAGHAPGLPLYGVRCTVYLLPLCMSVPTL